MINKASYSSEGKGDYCSISKHMILVLEVSEYFKN